MKLVSITEATMTWTGEITPILGDGRPESLNYGTGDVTRPNFLYIPIPLSRIRTMHRYLSRDKIAYCIESVGGHVVSVRDKDKIPENAIIIENPGRYLIHTGEGHITVSMGEELSRALGPNPIETLKELEIFDDSGRGIRTPIAYTGELRVMYAGYYKDESDPKGPILIAEQVSVPELPSIRNRLGLSSLPTLASGQTYIPHITYGYIAKKNLIHQSYKDKDVTDDE